MQRFRTYPTRRSGDLLLGRLSAAGATYFLTLCEATRRPTLVSSTATAALRTGLDTVHACGDLSLVAVVVMPDHIHVVGTLGPRLSLSRTVGKLKALTRRFVSGAEFEWQANYYEHRLRPDDDVEPYALYLFLNPYRAGLVALNRRWPFWWRWGDLRFDFEEMVARDGTVPPQWLAKPVPVGTNDL